MAMPTINRITARIAKMTLDDSDEMGLESRTVKRAVVGVGRDAKKKVLMVRSTQVMFLANLLGHGHASR